MLLVLSIKWDAEIRPADVKKNQEKLNLNQIYNPGHNILRHFDVWQNFRVTTSETNRD